LALAVMGSLSRSSPRSMASNTSSAVITLVMLAGYCFVWAS